jgi:flavin-dependent dehydrogenase
VRTSEGEVRADLVVDAAGRRSAIENWLAEIGAKPPATWWAECGVAYFTRHYRVRRDAQLPGPATSRLVVGLDEFVAGIWGADNGVAQLAVGPLATDRRFRTLKRPEVHTAVLRTVPPLAPWLDGLDPITDVYQMAGLHNTMRRLVVDGAPIVTGLHPVGDSICTTNPTLGRGLTLALCGAVDLVTTIEAQGEDWTAQALKFDELVGEHIHPYYEDQAAIDAGRLAMLRHAIEGTPAPDPPLSSTDRVTYSQLRTAAMFDPTAFRGFWHVQGMVRRPEDVYSDPEIVASTRDTLDQHKDDPAMPQPTREQLLAALAS